LQPLKTTHECNHKSPICNHVVPRISRLIFSLLVSGDVKVTIG
jgi:hypothetical protein